MNKSISPNLNPAPSNNQSNLARTTSHLWANRPLVVAGRVIIDTLLIVSAFLVAYSMRYTLSIGVELTEQYYVPLINYLPLIGFYSGLLLAVLALKGFYTLKRNASLLDEFGVIINSVLVAIAVMLGVVFIIRVNDYSRLMVVFLVAVSVLLLLFERTVVRSLRRQLWLRGVGVRDLLVIGATDAASRLMQAVVDTPNLGLRLVGYLDDTVRFSEWIMPIRYRNGQDVPHLGSLAKLDELIAGNQVNEIMIALPATHHQTINAVITRCREGKVAYTLVPDLFEMRVDLFSFTQINGVPLIGMKDTNLRGGNYLLKRALDILLAASALLILSPFLLLIALAIKLDSRGAIIYRQTRIGKNGKPFTFYKFRSMRTDADKEYFKLLHLNETGGATFKMAKDPRRTRVGKFIRRTSLDEIPQFVNILLGHMSFVGPRPTIDREIGQYQEWHRRRLEVTPGLTGLWQVSGRSKLPFEDMVKLDIYYAENWSLWLDIKILLRTIPAVIRGDGAY